jgi:hypothetical protein
MAILGGLDGLAVDGGGQDAHNAGSIVSRTDNRLTAENSGKTADWRGVGAADRAGFENRFPDTRNAGNTNELHASGESDLAACLAGLERESADLALIVRSWGRLAAPIRAGLVALVRSAVSTEDR